jgi:hypothetical protein
LKKQLTTRQGGGESNKAADFENSSCCSFTGDKKNPRKVGILIFDVLLRA